MGKAKAVRKESSAPPDSDSQSDYLLSKIQNHSRANLGWGGDCDVYPSFFYVYGNSYIQDTEIYTVRACRTSLNF